MGVLAVMRKSRRCWFAKDDWALRGSPVHSKPSNLRQCGDGTESSVSCELHVPAIHGEAVAYADRKAVCTSTAVKLLYMLHGCLNASKQSSHSISAKSVPTARPVPSISQLVLS